MTFPTFYDFVHFWDSLEIWAAAKAKKKIFIRNFAHLYLFVRKRQWALTKPLFLSKSIKTIEENAQRRAAATANDSQQPSETRCLKFYRIIYVDVLIVFSYLSL